MVRFRLASASLEWTASGGLPSGTTLELYASSLSTASVNGVPHLSRKLAGSLDVLRLVLSPVGAVSAELQKGVAQDSGVDVIASAQ